MDTLTVLFNMILLLYLLTVEYRLCSYKKSIEILAYKVTKLREEENGNPD